MSMTASTRIALARRLQISDAYLYQCLTGRKSMKPEQAVRIERDSDYVVRRWDVRRSDWHQIWPELIGAEGAPDVGAPAYQEAAHG